MRLPSAVLLALFVASSSTALAQPRPVWAARVDAVARAALARSGTPGATIAIVQNGALVYTQGYGLANLETRQPMTADMLLRVGSVSKMFTGLMLAQLAEQGQLDLNAPIGRYVTTLAGKRVGSVTALQLMTHSAGWLDNAVAYGRMGEGALGEVMREVGDTLFFTEPGRTFSYSNPSVAMAGYVAEVAGKKRFGALVDSLVLRAAGMPRSTFRPLEAFTWPTAMGHIGPRDSLTIVRPISENTAQWPAGFLFASAPELARFAIAMMQDGQIDGRQAFPAAAVRRATTGIVPHPGGSDLDSASYAMGLVVGRAMMGGQYARVWTHGGSINGYNASLTMVPDRKLAVIVLVNGPGAPIEAIQRAAFTAIGATRAPSPSPASRALTAAELALHRGRYAMARTSLEITDVDGNAVLKQGAATMPLTIAADGSLVARPADGTPLRLFTRLENGVITYVYRGSRALARQASTR